MTTLLLILLILLIVGALPTWPYSSGWGYYPSGTVGVIVVILVVPGVRGLASLTMSSKVAILSKSRNVKGPYELALSGLNATEITTITVRLSTEVSITLLPPTCCFFARRFK